MEVLGRAAQPFRWFRNIGAKFEWQGSGVARSSGSRWPKLLGLVEIESEQEKGGGGKGHWWLSQWGNGMPKHRRSVMVRVWYVKQRGWRGGALAGSAQRHREEDRTGWG